MQKALAVTIALSAVAMCLAAPSYAQSNAATDPDEARIQDIITASHILTNEGILDSFGHISARSVKNPNHFYMPRAMPPALVSRADIVESGSTANPSRPMRRASTENATFIVKCTRRAATFSPSFTPTTWP